MECEGDWGEWHLDSYVTNDNGTITISQGYWPRGAVVIPDTIDGLPVTSIGNDAFYECTSLTSVTIPNSVTSIGDYAFTHCSSLTRLYFKGNAPSVGYGLFTDANNVTVSYLPGTTGWDPTFAERPTAPWHLPYPVILTLPPYFGVQANQFGFRICWATNADVLVEGCPNLTNPIWVLVGTNALAMGVDPLTDGWSYFSDRDWTNYPARFYRVRSP